MTTKDLRSHPTYCLKHKNLPPASFNLLHHFWRSNGQTAEFLLISLTKWDEKTFSELRGERYTHTRKPFLNAFTFRHFLHISWEKADLSSAYGSLTCLPSFFFLPHFRSSVSISSWCVPPTPRQEQVKGRHNVGLDGDTVGNWSKKA